MDERGRAESMVDDTAVIDYSEVQDTLADYKLSLEQTLETDNEGKFSNS